MALVPSQPFELRRSSLLASDLSDSDMAGERRLDLRYAIPNAEVGSRGAETSRGCGSKGHSSARAAGRAASPRCTKIEALETQVEIFLRAAAETHAESEAKAEVQRRQEQKVLDMHRQIQKLSGWVQRLEAEVDAERRLRFMAEVARDQALGRRMY